MDQRIQNKIEQLKKMAAYQGYQATKKTIIVNNDSLGAVIKTKADAETFISELEAAVKRAE
jgi:hypothetical protein